MNTKRTLLSSFIAVVSINAYAAQPNATHPLSDIETTKKVNTLYHNSPLVHSRDIKVKTENHTVTLTGQVDTDKQFERAVSLAESVQGVDDVKTENLVIKASKSPMNDIVINAKVKGVFLKSGLLESNKPSQWPVKIETKNNVVFLSGSVSKYSTRKQLVALAQHVVGVKSVNSAVVIKA